MIAWLCFVVLFTLCLNFFAYSIHGAYVADCNLRPLPDKLFTIIKARDMGNLFYVAVDYVPFIVSTLFVLFDWSKSDDRHRLAATFLAGLTSLGNFKTASMQLTGIPPPYEFPPYIQKYEVLMQDAWKKTDSAIRGNADMLFSGHTSTTLFTLLLILRSAPLPETVPFVLLFMLFLFGIITTRFHYSMDVMVAIIVSSLVYFIAIRFLREKRPFFSSDLFKVNVLSVALASFSMLISILTFSCDWTAGVCLFDKYTLDKNLVVAPLCPVRVKRERVSLGDHC
jgi:membrane-associated phospholipid phosphatase